MTSVMDAIPAPDRYSPTSRYYGLGTTVHTTPDGDEIPYTPRRILPRAGDLAQIDEHTVIDGDRIDVLANRYLGDSEQWWRIADANPVLDQRDLTSPPGRTLRITLPAGVPGAPGGD
jgi:hypothetical protein